MRLEHVYGPNDSNQKFINNVLEKLKKNLEKIDLTLCQQKRDFIYVDDVVNAFSTVTDNLDRFLSGFYQIGVGTGRSISIEEFLLKAKLIYKSKSHLNFGAIPYCKNEIKKSKADNSFLTKLGWHPFHLIEDGIKKM
jgi:nucleoside-diphosphate-sugar epimerase